jgi:hypothetical protein
VKDLTELRVLDGLMHDMPVIPAPRRPRQEEVCPKLRRDVIVMFIAGYVEGK